MYSKDIYSSARSPYVKPPRNYSGTAFSGKPTGLTVTNEPADMPPEPQSVPKATEPAPAVTDPTPQESDTERANADAPPPEDEPEAVTASVKNAPPTPPRGILSSLIPPLFGDTESIGIGFEELLLIGLMFLVSQGERDTDTLLILMLLLFYK